MCLNLINKPNLTFKILMRTDWQNVELLTWKERSFMTPALHIFWDSMGFYTARARH